MLTCADALAQIRSPDDSRQKWLLVAELAEKIYESGSWRQAYGKVGDWLEVAAEGAGIGTNMLRRWLSARRFLISFGQAHPDIDLMGMGETGLLPFSAVEILKRMSDLSPDETVATIKRFKGEPITVRDLKRIYTPVLGQAQTFTIPGGRAKPFVEEMPFRTHSVDPRSLATKLADRGDLAPAEIVLGLIKERLAELSGPPDKVSLYLRHYRFRYVRPLAVAVGQQGHGIDFVDAFDLKRIRYPFARLNRNQLLSETEFSASFFRRYWLVLMGAQGEVAGLAEEISSLGLRSVGVMWVDRAVSTELKLLHPPDGAPMPDRTDMTKTEVFQQGVPV